jgi:hypothetical protein
VRPFPFAPKEIPLGDKGESKRSGEGATGWEWGYRVPEQSPGARHSSFVPVSFIR